MSDEFSKPPFRNLPEGIQITGPRYSRAERSTGYNTTGFTGPIGRIVSTSAFLNGLFPGRKAFYEDGDNKIKQLTRETLGLDGPNDQTERAMEINGVAGYSDWFVFGESPNLKTDFNPDPSDPSLTSTPFAPSPTSPQINDAGTPISDDPSIGYGRLPAPESFAENVEDGANKYRPGFIEENTEAGSKKKVRIQKIQERASE